MATRINWPVEDAGIRDDPSKCFYCGAGRGNEHRVGCVCRKRTVVVRTIVEHTIDVPEDWDSSIIEFTEGSSCSDNLISELADLVDRLDADPEGRCTCGMVTREFVREATIEDEEESNLFVRGLAS